MSKNFVFLAVGSFFAATVSLVKLNNQLQQSRNQKEKQTEDKFEEKKKDRWQSRAPLQTSTIYSDEEEDINDIKIEQNRELYNDQVTEAQPFKLLLKKPTQNLDINNLTYNILLNLNKSKGYQGVIKIKFSKSTSEQDLFLDYCGNHILYLSVNNNRIDQKEVIFQNHQILLKSQWLCFDNQIQIVFANKYAFMGDGLTCYFPLDQKNKYSLKGQVIYVRNGFYKIAKIIPCFNILNSCQVTLEVLHHSDFIAESNTRKSFIKAVTEKDYPKYSFLFENNNQFLLKNSYRLNKSTTSSSQGMKTVEPEKIKRKSKFQVSKLNSIHEFFVFCSSIVQIRPSKNLSKSRSSVDLVKDAMKDLIIRYFTKQSLLKKASIFVSLLQSQLIQIFQKVEDYRKTHNRMPKYYGKIDIFFVDDVGTEGDFYPGVIVLSQRSIQRGVIDRRLYFLLCRAIVGIAIMSKKKQILQKFQSLIKLNELTLQIFSECCDYIYVKNKQYENIRNQYIKLIKDKYSLEQQEKDLLRTQKRNKITLNHKQISQKERQKQKIDDRIYWILEYYEQQCRYFIANTEKFKKSVSINVRNILENLYDMDNQEYWAFFMARHSFIQFNVAQVLIKISLIYKGEPKNPSQIKYSKENFIRSEHYLNFYSVKQIQSHLKTLIQLKCYGIERALPLIKPQQNMVTWMPRNFYSYLSTKQNKKDCLKLYQQFRKYKEQKNFHHISALKRQIKRVQMLIREQIQQCQRQIQCSLQGWKLLSKLKIYPKDKQSYNLIKYLQKVKRRGQKQNPQQEKRCQQPDLAEQVRYLQKLLAQDQKI